MGSSKYAVMNALLLKTCSKLCLILLFNMFNLIKLGIFLIDTIGLKCDSTLEREECCMKNPVGSFSILGWALCTSMMFQFNIGLSLILGRTCR